ncbi:MAG: Hpt domain-containing protein [Burkholderiales bacterium]|nr:Hpt domain-containing protein [Burkholderiales bacterium]
MSTGLRLAQLDHAALQTIRSIGGSDELLRQVVTLFIESTPRLLQDIDAGLHSGDLVRLKIAAHTLKSSAANVGATVLSDMARRLEAAARDGSLPADLPGPAAVHDEFEAACRALKAVLDTAIR